MKKARPPRFSSDHQRRARELLAKYAAEPADERPFVEDDTEVDRERKWAAWKGFCGVSREAGEEVDAPQWWVDFAREPSNPARQSAAKSFLNMYVESS